MGLIRTLRTDGELSISSLRLHPSNDSLLCATSLEGFAALYDVRAEGPAVLTLTGHDGSVNASLFLDSGNYLSTASDDRTVRVFDMRKTDLAAQIVRGYRDAVNCVVQDTLSSNNIICGADDGCIYGHAYELYTEESPASTQHPGKWRMHDNFMVSSGTVNDLAVLPGRLGLYVSASEEGSIRVWNRDCKPEAQMEDRVVQSYDEFDNAVNHIHVTQKVTIPNISIDTTSTSWLFAACAEHVFGTTINHETGELGEHNLAFGLHSDYVRGVEAVTDNVLLTVSDDGTAVMWETATGRPTVQAKLNDQMIMAMAVGYTNGAGTPTVLYAGGEDGSITMWSLPLEGVTPAFDPSANEGVMFPRTSEWEDADEN